MLNSFVYIYKYLVVYFIILLLQWLTLKIRPEQVSTEPCSNTLLPQTGNALFGFCPIIGQPFCAIAW